MKKVITIVMVLVLFFLPAVSIAEETLAAKTDDELLAMYLEIQSILLSRSKKYSVNLTAGKYTVGVDLPAGDYRIECKGGLSSASVQLYQSKDESFPAFYTLAELYNSSVIGKLELRNGNILDISGSVLSLTSYNAAQIDIAVDEDLTKSAEAGSANEKAITVAPGKYHVGTEIPAGTYRIVCEGVFSMARVDLYDSQNALFPSKSELLSSLYGNAEIGKIELKQGNYLSVEEGTVKLYKYTGLMQ